jgi:hypothetical protein
MIIMVNEYIIKKFSNRKTPIVSEIAEYNRIIYLYIAKIVRCSIFNFNLKN